MQLWAMEYKVCSSLPSFSSFHTHTHINFPGQSSYSFQSQALELFTYVCWSL